MEKRVSPDFISDLKTNEVFVFGSNLDGAHGAGAARIARERFGAIWVKGPVYKGNHMGYLPCMGASRRSSRTWTNSLNSHAHDPS